MSHIIISTDYVSLGFWNTVKENGASATWFIGLGISKCLLIGRDS